MPSAQKTLLLIGFFFQWQIVWGQLRDTSLHSLFSRPFYYNVLKGKDGNIYAGTSEGIYRMDGAVITRVDNREGYLTQDAKGELVIDPNGIKYHDLKTFVHLLPFPADNRNEYHAGTTDYFYITSGGKMHVYEILPYDHAYRNHSVRTISQIFVGTYSGIYYRGQKLDKDVVFPDFTDGYIREYNGKAFICYSDLLVADLHQGDSLPTPGKDQPKMKALVNDVHYSGVYDRYYVACKNQLLEMERSLTSSRPVYVTQEKDWEVVLLGEHRNSVYFSYGKDFILYHPRSKEIVVVATLPGIILDGHLSTLNHYLLSSEALYVVHSDGRSQKLTDLKKAHTLLNLGNSDFAIATDAGLFLYNTVSNKLSELIRGVEFNRRGLYLQGDTLYAGSIDGLYKLDAKHLEQLSDRMQAVSQGPKLPAYMIPLLILLSILTVLFGYLLYHSRRRLARIIEASGAEAPHRITREEIEAFINNNLAQASVKSIAETFHTNNAQIYALFAPDKPGAIINRLRMDQVMRMRQESKSAREISEVTGFSEYYVRKVWNNKP